MNTELLIRWNHFAPSDDPQSTWQFGQVWRAPSRPCRVLSIVPGAPYVPRGPAAHQHGQCISGAPVSDVATEITLQRRSRCVVVEHQDVIINACYVRCCKGFEFFGVEDLGRVLKT